MRFQVKVEKRFSHGLQLLSHYTFAHAYKYDSTYYPDDPSRRLRAGRSGSKSRLGEQRGL